VGSATTTDGRPRSCFCGECAKCKRADYQRRWWQSLTPEQKREKIARRDPARVREQDRRKMARRRREGTPEQKQRIVARAAVRGLERQPCEVCGEPKTHAHHEDYSQPLMVRWLCRPHHEERHGRP
jgi:hypothetical protein